MQFTISRAVTTVASLGEDVWPRGPRVQSVCVRRAAGEHHAAVRGAVGGVRPADLDDMKLRDRHEIDCAEGLDDVLANLRALRRVRQPLRPFEREMIESARRETCGAYRRPRGAFLYFDGV